MQSNRSSTRLCFYITFLANLQMSFSFAIPSSAVRSILQSFDSIVYKAAIRLFVYCKDSFLEALHSLSEDDRTKALTLIIQHGYILKADIVAPKGKSQDAYSQELRNLLYFSFVNLTKTQLQFHTGMDSFTLSNFGIYYMRVLTYCAECSVKWMQTMVDVCTELLVCTGLDRSGFLMNRRQSRLYEGRRVGCVCRRADSLRSVESGERSLLLHRAVREEGARSESLLADDEFAIRSAV